MAAAIVFFVYQHGLGWIEVAVLFVETRWRVGGRLVGMEKEQTVS